MNNSNYDNDTVAVEYNMPLAVTKFVLGLITLTFYLIILYCIPWCSCISYSSRMFMIMLFSMNSIYYVVITFYTPIIASGIVENFHDEIYTMIISVIFLFPFYSLHLGQTIISLDRLVAIRLASEHKILFSKWRTRFLILFTVCYGLAFALPSFLKCCYISYNPILQVWIYPNDRKHYRLLCGQVSNYVNGALTAFVYCFVLYHINKMKKQINNNRIRQDGFKKEVTVFLIFAIPWFASTLTGVFILIIEYLPHNDSFYILSDFIRYSYILEPIVTVALVRQIRNILKQKIMCLCSSAKNVFSRWHIVLSTL